VALENRADQALILLHQGQKEMLGLDLLIAVLGCLVLGFEHRFLGFNREFVETHEKSFSGRMGSMTHQVKARRIILMISDKY
jgi:hypothetical protein